MKNYAWRYDTRLFKTKKEALAAIGNKEQWSDVQKYFKAKKSITKEYLYK